VSRLAEECEQELEKEVEQEEEEELQLPVENPYSEVDWADDKAFSDSGLLLSSKLFVRVKTLWDRHVPPLLGQVERQDVLYSQLFPRNRAQPGLYELGTLTSTSEYYSHAEER
jgi:hypothetical protein